MVVNELTPEEAEAKMGVYPSAFDDYNVLNTRRFLIEFSGNDYSIWILHFVFIFTDYLLTSLDLQLLFQLLL